MEDFMTNAKTNRVKGATNIGPGMDFSAIRMEVYQERESFLVLLPLEERNSHRTIHTVNQKLIKTVRLFLGDPIIDLRLTSQNLNKDFNKVTTKTQRMC